MFAVAGAILGGIFLWSAGVHVYVVDDAGNRTRIVAFQSMSVSSILAKAETRALQPEDVVTPDVDTVIPHGEIAIVRARPVTLTIDSVSETLYSTAETVKELLAENGVTLKEQDVVTPGPEEPVPYGDDIVVQRTTYAYVNKTETVAYKRVYQNNPYMEVGRSYISVMGQNGVFTKTIQITKVANKAVDTDVVKIQTVRQTVNEVYDVGSAKLDITPVKTFTMAATAYSNRRSTVLDGKEHLYGYSGIWLRYGTCAVDKKVIPIGTALYIEGYGYAVAADTGASIRGNKIDLFFNSYYDACRWGLRTVKVHVLPITRTQLYAKLGVSQRAVVRTLYTGE